MPDILIQPNADADDDLSNAIVMDDTTLPLSSQGAVALGLTLGTTYKARVLGVVETFSVAVPATAPAQMSAPTVTATGENSISVDLAAAPADGGSAITSYDLRYSTDETNWTEVSDVSDPETVSGLTASTLYYVQTRAVNAVDADPSNWSTSGTATTDAASGTLFEDDFTSYTIGDALRDNANYDVVNANTSITVQDDGGTRIAEVGTGDKYEHLKFVGATVSANRKVTWTYHKGKTGTGLNVNLYAAYTDSSNYVEIEVKPDGGASIRHISGGSGSFSTKSVASSTITEGDTLSIELDGTTMKAQLEGVDMMTPQTVPIVTLGEPGFRLQSATASATQAALSYFKIEEL